MSPPVDCEVSPWGPWTECSKTCGDGSKNKKRSVTQEKAGTGSECLSLSEQEECNIAVCPGNLSYTMQ